jgi:hypothetical protein
MRHWLLSLLLIFCIWNGTTAQSPVRRPRLPTMDTLNQNRPPDDTAVEAWERAQALKRAEYRRNSILKDTDKLAQLVSELKASLVKNDSAKVLSLDSVRKAEDIEKLARKVKDNLRDTGQ